MSTKIPKIYQWSEASHLSYVWSVGSLSKVIHVYTIKKWLIEGHYLYCQGFYFWYFNSLRSTPFFWCVFHFLCSSLQSRTPNEARRKGGGREVACVADTLNHLRIQMVETMHGPAATQASGRGSARKKGRLFSLPSSLSPPENGHPPLDPNLKKRKKSACFAYFQIGCRLFA